MLLNQTISEKDHRRNFSLLFGQSFFFLLTINILDKDTVLPGLLSRMGAGEILIGLLSVITIGLPKFSQFFFGLILQNKSKRKPYVIQGFVIRFTALFAITYVLWQYYLFNLKSPWAITLILLFYTIYSLAAAYTTVGIVDLVPRSLFLSSLKKFYSLKQLGNSLGIFLSILIVKPLLKTYPFPLNYSILHFVAAITLITSTLMLLGVKERIILNTKKLKIKEYYTFVINELKRNPALLYLSLIVNSEGLFLSIVPFFTTYAILSFSVNAKLIGTLFAWKIIGVLVSSAVLVVMKDYKYFRILSVNIAISVLVPVLLLISGNELWAFKAAFFGVGVFNSIYRITYEGILVEISNDQNRATYASVLGTSNISTFIIPLLSGSLIRLLGYKLTFIFAAALLAVGVLFLIKLRPYLKA